MEHDFGNIAATVALSVIHLVALIPQDIADEYGLYLTNGLTNVDQESPL